MVNDLLLQHYKAGQFGVPIALPNRNFDPSKLKLWGRWQLMPTLNYKGNLIQTEKAGILQITLFTLAGQDDTAMRYKADAIVEHFGTEKQFRINGHNIIIMSSVANPSMPDNKWFMQPITIKYQII